MHCHLAPGGAECTLPDVLPAWHRAALLGGVTADEAPAPRVSVGITARGGDRANERGGDRGGDRGGACRAGLRVRTAQLRRALRREEAPLVEVEVESGVPTCDSSVRLSYE